MYIVEDEYNTIWKFESEKEALEFYWERKREDYYLDIRFEKEGV